MPLAAPVTKATLPVKRSGLAVMICLTRHRDLENELSRDNGLRNIVGDGFAARVRLGESADDDKAAVRVGPDWR